MSDTDLNPQSRQMADESMVRTLDAQITLIWPQEIEILRRYGLHGPIRILDAGCGTGAASERLAELFPDATILGVDIVDEHLDLASHRCARFGPRVRFGHETLFALDEPNGWFDLTVCRHVIHSIPHAERVVAELARVTRAGGRLHVIAEDYHMLHFQPGALDPSDFWHEGPVRFGEATGTDLLIGRRIVPIFQALGLTEIRLDYVVVDTLRTPREVFAAMMVAWRDGYVDPIAEHTQFSREQATAYFNQMIEDIQNPARYALWLVPVASARVP